MNLKSNKAITLVALIITIIILLILAGVTLSMVLGDNGLIDKAQSSVEKYQEGANNEQKLLNSIEEYIMTKEPLTLSKTSGTYTCPTAGSFEITSDISKGGVTITSSDEDIVTASISGKTITVTPVGKAGIATIMVSYQGKTATHEATVEFVNSSVTVGGYDFYVIEDDDTNATLLCKTTIGTANWSNAKSQASTFGISLGGSGRLMTETEARGLTINILNIGNRYWLNDYYGIDWDGESLSYMVWDDGNIRGVEDYYEGRILPVVIISKDKLY